MNSARPASVNLFCLFVALQGVIPVSFSKVNELLLNSDDPGKYLFEIVPRKKQLAATAAARLI